MQGWTQTLWPKRPPGRPRGPWLTVECLEDRSLMAVVVLGPFSFSGAQETPPNASVASGTATVTVDTTALKFSVDATVTGIPLANVTGFHLHRGPAGVAGPIKVNLLAFGSFVMDGANIHYAASNIPLPADELSFLLAGHEYLNVHSTLFINGEIRGQIPSSGGALADVTSQVHVTVGKPRFDPATGRSRLKVTITNHGGDALQGPLSLVLRNLARKIKLRKATGLTTVELPAGSPFKRINPPGGALGPGASVTVLLEFKNPGQRKIRFTSQVFEGSGTL